jgi:hypothetical protein
MSCFKIPDTICFSINSMTSKFWWGKKANERKMHWKSWNGLCSPKGEGGMGFHNLKLFNSALLAKQVWRLIVFPNSLLGRILKAKYFPNYSIMDANIPPHSSFTWRSIASAREVIKLGSSWRIGNGSQIRVWHDKWIPFSRSHKILSPIQRLPLDARVSDLISPPSSWNETLLAKTFLPFEAAIIKNIPLRSLGRADKCFGERLQRVTSLLAVLIIFS